MNDLLLIAALCDPTLLTGEAQRESLPIPKQPKAKHRRNHRTCIRLHRGSLSPFQRIDKDRESSHCDDYDPPRTTV